MRVLFTTLAVAGAGLSVVVPSGAQTATPPAPAKASTDRGQAFFLAALIKDAKTTRAIREALDSGAAIVDPATQYADLTGDGKSDAVVRVHSTGAAGVIAVYVFSTDGAKKRGALRVLFRTQSLYRALTDVAATRTLVVDQPRYAAGDDLCCPHRLTRRRYRFSAKSHTFVRTSLETVALP